MFCTIECSHQNAWMYNINLRKVRWSEIPLQILPGECSDIIKFVMVFSSRDFTNTWATWRLCTIATALGIGIPDCSFSDFWLAPIDQKNARNFKKREFSGNCTFERMKWKQMTIENLCEYYVLYLFFLSLGQQREALVLFLEVYLPSSI